MDRIPELTVEEQLDRESRRQELGTSRLLVVFGAFGACMTVVMIAIVSRAVSGPAPGIVEWMLLIGIGLFTIGSWIGAIRFAAQSRRSPHP